MVRAYQRSFIDWVVGSLRLMSGTTKEHPVQANCGSPRYMCLARVKTKARLVVSAHCWWCEWDTKDFVNM